MKAAIYLGQEQVEVRELPDPVCGDNDVVIQNICSSICGTDVAVYTKGPNTGHKITVGGEFGHETVSRVVATGKNVTDFRLGIAENLGFSVCSTKRENFIEKAEDYFGTAPSLTGTVPDIDCWINAAGAESILDSFMQYGKIISRFVAVAVNNKPRRLDLLHMTYSQKSIIGSGGYFPEDVRDVMAIMAGGKWNLESVITQEFPLERISEAIRTAADPDRAFNVTIRF